ncbi:hypothetical protein LK07_09530 [Streptomyces pluripotens]|uniref:Uncharacterized protein n=1 Tax=Streptomyces pluripotens TaxID=1355015 RepID=A0A221NW96_9ACTN|nr:hypothetical protein [Streptomyces pluripotens]ARP69983.1 hypothetical protein LK06_008425 [Streptomyces pluripotens]ASN24241.1 hypothetical protein LK07_09530 [Streptomyces pluripotens]
MTACAIEPPSAGSSGADDVVPAAGCVLTTDGAYAARLALDGDSWFPERWTLDGPEPYAVPLPGNQPEEPGTEVQPLGDGRVLIHRLVERRHAFALLYPTGPGTGELPLGAVECPEPGTRLTLLPPAPGGAQAYALAVGPRSSAVWLVAGGAFGPERLAEVPGRCSGGIWLDGTGRILALDRELGGRTKTVVVDLERGEISPLLQISERSDDRLLLADADSGLLLIASDAPSPGEERLGWGVLGSTLPVRFPECLRVPDCRVVPFAVQPGQVLMPENCAVALRIDGAFGTWVGTWRPVERQVTHLPAPGGWLTGSGLWTRDGVLRLPYATQETPCGVAELTAPRGETGSPEATGGTAGTSPSGGTRDTSVAGTTGTAEATGTTGFTRAAETRRVAGVTGNPVGATWGSPGDNGLEGPVRDGTATGAPGVSGVSRAAAEPVPPMPVVTRPVPLQQAPLSRLVTK